MKNRMVRCMAVGGMILLLLALSQPTVHGEGLPVDRGDARPVQG